MKNDIKNKHFFGKRIYILEFSIAFDNTLTAKGTLVILVALVTLAALVVLLI
jgi:hypothetical protein